MSPPPRTLTGCTDGARLSVTTPEKTAPNRYDSLTFALAESGNASS